MTRPSARRHLSEHATTMHLNMLQCNMKRPHVLRLTVRRRSDTVPGRWPNSCRDPTRPNRRRSGRQTGLRMESRQLRWLARVCWTDVTMARPCPQEFSDDVVRVARNRYRGVTIGQITPDLGVHPITLTRWMRQAEVDHGAKPGTTTSGSTELRRPIDGSSCSSRTTRCCVGPRRYLSQSNLPERVKATGSIMLLP